jgi:Flp pilus assembly protein TadD
LDQALRIDDSNARLQALESTVTFHPYLAEAWRARALAWRTLADGKSPFRSRRLERAVEDLSVCLRLRPQWADAWADRGWIRGMLGDLDAAGRDLDRARELDPTHSGIRLLGEALRAPALRK